MSVYIKQKVYPHEYAVYCHVQRHVAGVNTPKIIAYDPVNLTLTMEKINGLNLSDMHGEKAHHISTELFTEVRGIIRALYDAQVVYPDITGYNFIRSEDDGKLYVIDFEHAFIVDPFIQQFLAGENAWNPEYA